MNTCHLVRRVRLWVIACVLLFGFQQPPVLAEHTSDDSPFSWVDRMVQFEGPPISQGPPELRELFETTYSAKRQDGKAPSISDLVTLFRYLVSRGIPELQVKTLFGRYYNPRRGGASFFVVDLDISTFYALLSISDALQGMHSTNSKLLETPGIFKTSQRVSMIVKNIGWSMGKSPRKGLIQAAKELKSYGAWVPAPLVFEVLIAKLGFDLPVHLRHDAPLALKEGNQLLEEVRLALLEYIENYEGKDARSGEKLSARLIFCGPQLRTLADQHRVKK